MRQKNFPNHIQKHLTKHVNNTLAESEGTIVANKVSSKVPPGTTNALVITQYSFSKKSNNLEQKGGKTEKRNK